MTPPDVRRACTAALPAVVRPVRWMIIAEPTVRLALRRLLRVIRIRVYVMMAAVPQGTIAMGRPAGCAANRIQLIAGRAVRCVARSSPPVKMAVASVRRTAASPALIAVMMVPANPVLPLLTVVSQCAFPVPANIPTVWEEYVNVVLIRAAPAPIVPKAAPVGPAIPPSIAVLPVRLVRRPIPIVMGPPVRVARGVVLPGSIATMEPVPTAAVLLCLPSAPMLSTAVGAVATVRPRPAAVRESAKKTAACVLFAMLLTAAVR